MDDSRMGEAPVEVDFVGPTTVNTSVTICRLVATTCHLAHYSFSSYINLFLSLSVTARLSLCL